MLQKKKPNMNDTVTTALTPALRDPSVIRILVGPEQVPFAVHEKLATHHSSYFKSMLTGPYTEAKSKEIEWVEEDPAAVELLVTWLYAQKVDLENVWLRGWPIQGGGNKLHPLNTLKLAILADKRGVPKLFNEVITILFNDLTAPKDRGRFTLGIVGWLWENTVPGSKLRDLMLDYKAATARLEDFNHKDVELPADFYVSFIQRMPGARKKVKNTGWREDWRVRDICQYHEHPNGINCFGFGWNVRRDANQETNAETDGEVSFEEDPIVVH